MERSVKGRWPEICACCGSMRALHHAVMSSIPEAANVIALQGQEICSFSPRNIRPLPKGDQKGSAG